MTDGDAVKIAVLQTQMKSVDDAVKQLAKDQQEGFKKVFDQLDAMGNFEDRLKRLEEQVKRNWVTHTLSAILGAILTGMIATIGFLITHR